VDVLEKAAARDRRCAERGQVAGLLLAIDHLDAMALQKRH
jgi:hypothetical protein